MIQLKLKIIPSDLASGQLEWTASLINLVKNYGGYAKIPGSEKDKVLINYNLKGVRHQLKKMAHGKCCYCESRIEHIDFPHIEHFWPKSLYPKFAFKWSNFLLSCKKCNLKKSNFDTKDNPFIHPVNDNPENYLTYSELRIIPHPNSPNQTKSINTIFWCNLKRSTLFRLRADLRIEFNGLEQDIDEVINDYSKLKQKYARLSRLVLILDSLDNLKILCKKKNQYAGYVRHMCTESTTIMTAVELINLNLSDLGLNKPYQLFK
jgi:uncharacterized protein (TIGR02646 family)